MSALRLAVMVFLGVTSLSVWADQFAPNPKLTPKQVVAAQLDALKNVDTPQADAGFARVFAFTSPGNRQQTGPLSRFSRMLKENYGGLINHRSSRMAATKLQGRDALQPVTVNGIGGAEYRYVFILHQQESGAYQDCWMTDGVVAEQTERQTPEV